MIQFDKDKQDNVKNKDGNRELKGGKVLYLLYRQGHPKTKVRSSLHFMKLAQEAVYRVAEKHFFDLLAQRGDSRQLTSRFKYYEAAMADSGRQ
ncbi:MAG: hypothetical protein LBC63_02745 [Holophagales bacterium]|nr:hypothetical protein [Holophagales bacterium]